MKTRKNLDQALNQFREVTSVSAPLGMAAEITRQLAPAALPISFARFFGMISLGAAATAVVCTLLMVSGQDAPPPPLSEFSSLQVSGLFAHP